jgi:hypothetical protein
MCSLWLQTCTWAAAALRDFGAYEAPARGRALRAPPSPASQALAASLRAVQSMEAEVSRRRLGFNRFDLGSQERKGVPLPTLTPEQKEKMRWVMHRHWRPTQSHRPTRSR